MIAFVDYENIWTGLMERGAELTPEILVKALQHYAEKNDFDLSAVYLYANFDREEFWRTQTSFERTLVYTRHVYGKNNYSSTALRPNAADIELFLEAQEILITRSSTFDMFLLLTGDGDFLPLVRKIRAWGKEVGVIGVNGSINNVLIPFCDSTDFFAFLSFKDGGNYNPQKDIEQGIIVIAALQSSLVYVASTKARGSLSEKLGLSITQVKELIRYGLNEKIIFQKEYEDHSLKIGKTKIYLLNLEHELVKKVLDHQIEEIRARYQKIGLN